MGRDNPEMKRPLPSLLAGACVRSPGGRKKSPGVWAWGGRAVEGSRLQLALHLALNLPAL